jgi:hypothetical protein
MRFSLLGTPRHPDPPPLETDDVTTVAVGTLLWAVGLVVLVVLRLTGATRVEDWWLVMCLCGIALGLIGIRYCSRRQAALARDRTRGSAPRA